MVEIEFNLGKLDDAAKWLSNVYVYSMGPVAFAITYEKHPTLEKQAEHKFIAKSTMKSDEVVILLPESFARDYFDNTTANVYRIEEEGHDAILIISEKKA